jgi:hypothetical protein
MTASCSLNKNRLQVLLALFLRKMLQISMIELNQGCHDGVSLNYASLDEASLDEASLGLCIPWTMRPLDDASLGRCVPRTLHPCRDG